MTATGRRRRNPRRFAAGVLIWLVGLGGLVVLARSQGAEVRVPVERVVRYAVKTPRRVTFQVPAAWDEKLGAYVQLVKGDPLLWTSDRTYVGSVEECVVEAGVADVVTPTLTVHAAFDPEFAPEDFEGATFDFETASGDARWVLATLLPEHKRQQVKDELFGFVQTHKEQIAGVVRPIGEDVLAYAVAVVDSNLAPALKKHEHEFQALADRHRGSLKEDLLPVLKAQLGPSIKEKAKPILTQIGRECWDALPMWGLGWSAIRDKLPWQSRSYVDEWWADFLENKAMPIVKQHEPELVKAGEELLQEAIRDPKVRAAMSGMTKKLLADPEFKKLLRAVLEEALVRPFEVQVIAKRILDDPKHRERLTALEHEAAPTLQKVARMVTLDERGVGLSPDLARVLRRVVFRKDQRWVSVTTTGPIRRLSPSVGPGPLARRDG